MVGGHDREHRVQVRAYHLWEAEGCPEGREAEFWHRAVEIDHLESAAGQDSGAAPQLKPEPASAVPAKKLGASAAKPKQAAASRAAPRKRASAPVPEGNAPKPNSARARVAPAEHP